MRHRWFATAGVLALLVFSGVSFGPGTSTQAQAELPLRDPNRPHQPWWLKGEGRFDDEDWRSRVARDAGMTPSWLPGELFGLVDEGLAAMGMNRADLEFEKKVAGPQQWLVDAVALPLDEPLVLPRLTDRLVGGEVDPFVAMGLMSKDERETVGLLVEKLSAESLITLIVGEDVALEAAGGRLSEAMAARRLGEMNWAYFRSAEDWKELGRDISAEQLVGGVADVPNLVRLFACVHADLRVAADRLPQRVAEIATGAVDPHQVDGAEQSVGADVSSYEAWLLMSEGINGIARDSAQSESARPDVEALRRAISTNVDSPASVLTGLSPAASWVVWRHVSKLFAHQIHARFMSMKRAVDERAGGQPTDALAILKQGIDVTWDVMPTGAKRAAGRRLVIGGIGDDWHQPRSMASESGLNARDGQPVLLVELGGCDSYVGLCAVATSANSLVAVYDFGYESDRYLGGPTVARDHGLPATEFDDLLGPCAAYGGCAVLEDHGGNDRYEGGDFSIAAAWGGYAVLVDHSGSDTYRGGTFTQGAAAFGVAELLDKGTTPKLGEDAPTGYAATTPSSNDTYTCHLFGQGFGYIGGVGRLEDTGGNDSYKAGGVHRHMPLWNDRYQSLSQGFGFGSRTHNIAGGIGMLIDRGEGNDSYDADIYGQGSSYWYALGICWDEGGNDHYRLGHYGQGAGIHLSSGILVDHGGNDTYTNFYGVGCGGAHDYAVGWLVDLKGDDSYYANGLAQALNNSVSVFYDGEGDDVYSSRTDSAIGCGTNNSIAFLIDGGGNDRYTAPITNGLWHVRGEYGICMDLLGAKDKPRDLASAQRWRTDGLAGRARELANYDRDFDFPPPPPEADLKLPPAVRSKAPLERAELEALWKKACEWEVGTKENIESIAEARRALVEHDALGFLLEQLHHTYPLQLRALWGTIPHFQQDAVEPLMKVVRENRDKTISSPQISDTTRLTYRRRNAIELLTRIIPDRVSPELKSECADVALDESDDRERLRLLTSLTRWPELGSRIREGMLVLADSEQDIVRKLALEGLAPMMRSDGAWDHGTTAFLADKARTDPYFAVRIAARRILLGGFDMTADAALSLPSPDTGADPVSYPTLILLHAQREARRATPRDPTAGTKATHAALVAEALGAFLTGLAETSSSHPASLPAPSAVVFGCRELHAQLAASSSISAAKSRATFAAAACSSALGTVTHPVAVAALLELSWQLEQLIAEATD